MKIDNVIAEVDEWENSNIQAFWGEIAPCDHLIQIYESDKIFLDTLEGFAGAGILAGDSVVIIATNSHLKNLNKRLVNQGFDLESLSREDRYFPLEANETLSKFMVNDWPDDELFNNFISGVIEASTQGNRKLRAFGEMVAVLWEKGLNGATVRLEHLWCDLQNKKDFTLYCAYPKNGFTQSAADSMHTICKSHTKIIDGQARPVTEIYYREIA